MEQNKTGIININSAEIKLKQEAVVALLGYGADDSDAHVDSVIKQSIKESYSLLEPKAGYIILPVEDLDVAKGVITVYGEVFNVNRIIASQLRKAEFVALFACTIGEYNEKRSKELIAKGDYLEGYVFDLLGSEAAESCADILHNHIKEEVRKNGFNITNRFSPGYCNWDVKEQFKLFKFFPEKFCDIRLTSSALMNPVKSVSGLLGIGENVQFKPYTCTMCSDKNCIYRNKKSHK